MSPQKQSILIIDDEVNMRHMLMALLSRHGFEVSEAANGKEGIALLKETAFDFILCDVRMPEMDGMQFLQKLAALSLNPTVIMMSAYGSIDNAVQAMKLGAYDYISKPFKEDEIVLVLKKAQERNSLLKENKLLRERVHGPEQEYPFGKMIGKSKAMDQVFELAGKVAPYDTTVLITGESGTGKELLARGIHDASLRADGPFVAVNCGALPENLIESELFGYVKGAFTGADQNNSGLFEEAGAGTIFLDEIGELPLNMQVKLLRVLQEREVRKVGAKQAIPVDVRVVAATARNLEKMVAEGTFREDLFYRLNIVNIHLPPLRERPADLVGLCMHFIKKCNRRLGKKILSISPDALEKLKTCEWPGNVRELENVIERAVILAESQTITMDTLVQHPPHAARQRRVVDFLGTCSLKEAKVIMERNIIRRVMGMTGGNKSKAADMLEISYPALLKKLKEYDC